MTKVILRKAIRITPQQIDKAVKAGIDYSTGPSKTVAILRKPTGEVFPIDYGEIERRLLAQKKGKL